jgi:hypothetical protein
MALLPAALALMPLGCSTTAIEMETYPLRDTSPIRFEADRAIQYQDYLILMDGEQRQQFFELTTSLQKKRFVNEKGIVVKKMLKDNIRRHMTKTEVEGLLGVPERKSMEDYAHYSSSRYDRLVDEWWIYQETHSGNLVFLPFKNGWLVDWLMEKKVRSMVFVKTSNEKELRIKQGRLIHLQEEIPSLLRRPGEELDVYRDRLRRVAPIVFSESPPSWPDVDYGRKMVSSVGFNKLTKRDIYGLWGKTAKIFELALEKKPKLPYDKLSRWVYRVFNGRDFTYYCVNFANGRVIDWDVSDYDFS